MSEITNERKIQHIQVINDDKEVDRKKYFFDRIHLTHRALPEIDLKVIDPSLTFMGKRLSFPLLISSMTGGDHEVLRMINRNLAIAAEKTGVAMGVGSQRVMFVNDKARESFEIRNYAPNTLLFANLGAVQLNYGFTIDHCRQALAAMDADALYFHLNPLQEAVQPEGETNFANLAGKIIDIAQRLDKPIILKEVGAGISYTDVERIASLGIRFIDIAGTGGTSWSRIEFHRQTSENRHDLGIKFQDWGIPTPLALKLLKPYRDRVTLIASGGIRSGIDMIKSVILGASLCGMASPFLKPAMDSVDLVIEAIENLKREFTVAMFLLGVSDFKQLWGNESLILTDHFFD